ncbi:LOW QUALITY PROTEIN: 6-phosphofructokinase, partial [Streptomyces sviceus ATCC 29083]
AHWCPHLRRRLSRPERRHPVRRAPCRRRPRRRGHRFPGRLEGPPGVRLPQARPRRGGRHPGPRRHDPRFLPGPALASAGRRGAGQGT